MHSGIIVGIFSEHQNKNILSQIPCDYPRRKRYIYKIETQGERKRITHEPIYSSVYFSPQENSFLDLLIWANKGLRINICFCHDIISWLVNTMMGIEKTAVYTDI